MSGFIATALKNSLKKGYSLSAFKSDVIAGLVVSLVALPLAMALAIAVGLPPEHGLYTAIVAGLTVPLLGGSTYQVSGPTAAFVVIIAPIVAAHGLRGLLIATLLASFLLIAMGLLKLGRIIYYVPYPVTMGFTTGIAVVIATIALNDLLGLHIEKLESHYLEKLLQIGYALPHFNTAEACIGLLTLFTLLGLPRLTKKIPPALVGIAIGTFTALFLTQNGFSIDTIGSRFSYILEDGTKAAGIPPFAPSLSLFHLPTLNELSLYIVPAVVIALLAALESLLSATVADSLKSGKHNPNSELIGIGIGNLLSSLTLGIPATGAIARTSLNIQSGAKTPLASSIHALFLLLYVLFLAPWMSYIPMASLAALLLAVAYHMASLPLFLRTLKIAPSADKVVLLVCCVVTVLVDMVAGVAVGVLFACFLLLTRLSSLTKTALVIPHQTPEALHYRISGLLFFGTAEKAFDRLASIDENIKTVLIDIEEVPFVDMTGLVALKQFVLSLQAQGKKVHLLSSPEVAKILARKLPHDAKNKMTFAKSALLEH